MTFHPPAAIRDDRASTQVVLLFVAVWTLVISGVAVWRVWGLGANGSDLGFFVHALGAVARQGLNAPASWAGWSLLEDHFSPILLPLAPLAATRWGGYLLVAAQALAAGWAVWWAWRLTGDKSLTFAYAMAPALVFPLFFDIHANIVALPFVLMATYGFRHRPSLAVIGGLLAAFSREDVAAVIVLLGLLHWKTNEGKLIAGGGLAAICGWLLTRSSPSGYASLYGWIEEPGRVFDVVWADGLLLLLVLALTLPWAFFELDWRYVLLAVAAAAPYVLVDSLPTASLGFQYYALPITLMLAAVKPGRRRPVQVTAIAVLGILGGPFLTGILGPGGVTVPNLAESIEERATFISQAHEAIAWLPDHPASIPTELTPLTGHLKEVYIFPHPFKPLTFTHGDQVRVSRQAMSIRPEYVLAPPPVDGYRHVVGIVWQRGDSG